MDNQKELLFAPQELDGAIFDKEILDGLPVCLGTFHGISLLNAQSLIQELEYERDNDVNRYNSWNEKEARDAKYDFAISFIQSYLE